MASNDKTAAYVPSSLWSADDLEERKWNYLLQNDESLGEEEPEELSRSLDAPEPKNPMLNVPNLNFDLPEIVWDTEEFQEQEEELTRGGLEMNEIYCEKRRSIAVKPCNKKRSACVVSDEEYILAKTQAEKAVDEIIAKKILFKDPKWPMTNKKKILFRNGQSSSTASFNNVESKIQCWKRLTKIISNPVVFRDGINPNDIKQGSIGSCWFLSALSVVGVRAERIQKCLVKYNSRLGVYGFVFFKNGRWHHVIIDDYFPISKNSGNMLFSRSTDPQETWVALFEKAFAKLHGSYEMIVGGHVSNGVVDLTGGCSSVLSLKDMNEDAKTWLWKQLANKASKNWRCTGCSNYRGGPEAKAKTGLVSGHAYGIINTYKSHGVQLVQIRNPWGHFEWKGAWSDKSAMWKKNPQVAKAIKPSVKDDGVFWMSWDDFLANWDRVYLVKCFSKNWKVTQRFKKTNATGVYTTSFHLDVAGPLAIMVLPECNAFKGDLAKKNSYPPLSFTILQNGAELATVKVNGFRGGSWWSAASGYNCPVDNYSIRVRYKTRSPSPFYVRVYSRTDLTLSALK